MRSTLLFPEQQLYKMMVSIHFMHDSFQLKKEQQVFVGETICSTFSVVPSHLQNHSLNSAHKQNSSVKHLKSFDKEIFNLF